MKYLITGFILLVLVLIAPYLYFEWWPDRDLRQQIRSSVKNMDISRNQTSEQAGYVVLNGTHSRFTEEELHKALLNNNKGHLFDTCYWNSHGVLYAAVSALGLDYLHHFANSYLVGFEPFKTDSPWVPLYALTLRKHYQYDHIQYGGYADIWQNSQQAFYYTRGDCEDHSIILADWLISMGLDARVVLGTFKGNGHAWVVLVMGEKQYLLEATGKRKMRSLNPFQLAQMVNGYLPEYQFNRDELWYNNGNKLTRRYTGDHWVLKSRYVNYKNELESGEND